MPFFCGKANSSASLLFGGQVKHIKGLIDAAEMKSPTLAAELKAKVDTRISIVVKIKKLRSKVFAHRDKDINPNLLMQQYGLAYKDIREIVEMAQDVVSDLAEALDVRSKSDVMKEFTSFEKSAVEGCRGLFDSIRV